MPDDKTPTIGAMAAAAAAVISGIGALTLTGSLGRVQRNNGTVFLVGLALVILGAAMWVAASVISAEARPIKWSRGRNDKDVTIGIRPGVQVTGVLLSLVGLIIALGAAVATANDTEQPSVKLTLEDDGKAASGIATVANLSSEDRLSVTVDGLERRGSDPYGVTVLFQAEVGPDSDGKATVDAKLPLPADRFDALGIRAWTETEPRGCMTASSEEEEKDGTGCIILQLKVP